MICKVEGLDIYYETYGEGKPVLMLHGYGIDHNVMAGCMEPIFKGRPGYKRIYIDLPGMGRSKAADWLKNSDQVIDIIVKFYEEVISDSNFLVAGESYGGYLARGLAYKEPQRLDGLLLICPVIIAEKSKRELPPRKVFARDDKMLEGIEPQARKLFERMLVLQDATAGFKDVLKIIDDYLRGTFAVLDRAGHGLEVEQEALFNGLVGEWLDRVEGYEERRTPCSSWATSGGKRTWTEGDAFFEPKLGKAPYTN